MREVMTLEEGNEDGPADTPALLERWAGKEEANRDIGACH